MRCRAVRDNLMAYIASELSPEQNDAIRNHLSACRACEQKLEAASAASDALATLGTDEEAPELIGAVRRRLEQRQTQPARQRVLGLAAAAVAAASLVAVGSVWLMQGKVAERRPIIVRTPETRHISKAPVHNRRPPIRQAAVDNKKPQVVSKVNHKAIHIVEKPKPRPPVKQVEKPVVMAKLSPETQTYFRKIEPDGDNYSAGRPMKHLDESSPRGRTERGFGLDLKGTKGVSTQLTVPNENAIGTGENYTYEPKYDHSQSNDWYYNDQQDGMSAYGQLYIPPTLGDYALGWQNEGEGRTSQQAFKDIQAAKLGQLAFFIKGISDGNSRLLIGQGSGASPKGYVMRHIEWGDMPVITAYWMTSAITRKCERIGDCTVLGAINVLVRSTPPSKESKLPKRELKPLAEPGVYLIAYKGEKSDDETQNGRIVLLRLSVTNEGVGKLNKVLEVPAKRYTRSSNSFYAGLDWYGTRVEFKSDVPGRADITIAVPDPDQPYRSYEFQLDLQVKIV